MRAQFFAEHVRERRYPQHPPPLRGRGAPSQPQSGPADRRDRQAEERNACPRSRSRGCWPRSRGSFSFRGRPSCIVLRRMSAARSSTSQRTIFARSARFWRRCRSKCALQRGDAEVGQSLTLSKCTGRRGARSIPPARLEMQRKTIETPRAGLGQGRRSNHADGMSAGPVRRGKAALSSGCESHPATAPAGSNRSSYGGNEMAEAFG